MPSGVLFFVEKYRCYGIIGFSVNCFCSIKIVCGVLHQAFQMAFDDDMPMKNAFGFGMGMVVVNDSVMKETITKDQMWKSLKFVHDDNVYYKYCEVVYILFHIGMRISEFCGLTIRNTDMESKVIKSTTNYSGLPI